jgi:hypothetical protein
VGGLIYIPHPCSHVCPFSSRVRPPPLQHTPVRARARCCTRPRCRTRPHPNTCPRRNGCARIAFRPGEDTVFAPDPTRPHPFTRVCAHNRGRAKSPRLVPRVRSAPRVRAWSPRSVPRICAWSPYPAPPVRARSHPSAPGVCARSHASTPGVRARSHPPAPISTRSRPTRSCFY